MTTTKMGTHLQKSRSPMLSDMKKARQMMLAVDADALRERDAMPEVYRQYLKLDEIDRAKVEAYITGLLSSDKYQTVAKAKNA